MLTLVPGASRQGFTLLELLVVIVVLSIAAGLIVVRGIPGDSSYLETEAKKLAQLLRIAQQESLLKSKTIRFIANEEGYGFEEYTGTRWAAVSTEPMLRARRWDNGPFKVTLLNEGAANRFLTLENTVGLARQSVVLQRNQVQIVLESRASGLFHVGRPRTIHTAAGKSS